MTNRGFNTNAIHGKILKEDVQHAIKYPVYEGVAYYFESAEDIEGAFTGKKPAHTYSRITNPTVEAFEQKMTLLEDGKVSIAVSSGMAAITNVVLALVKAGENIVTADSLFGGTYSLFSKTLSPVGIETRFVDIDDLAQVEKAIDENTRILFFETITNPKMNVPDADALAKLAHKYNVVVVVDNTLTSPYLFSAKQHGVDIAIHSTTKFISGGASSVGGVICDLGTFDWSKVPALERFHKFGDMALVARFRKEVFRDLGSCLAPQAAHLQSLGLETLTLRMDKCCENALKIAKWLKTLPQVKSVNYPGLEESPFHDLAKKQFGDKYGSILTFELADKETCFKFENNLKLIKRATNLGDNTTLIIHPASTIFSEYTPEARTEMCVAEGLLRLSVGIEDVEDLQEDILQAL